MQNEIISHIDKVHEWLSQNVLVYKNVSTVTLFGFDIPESKARGVYSGCFKVKFDQQECPRDFKFSTGDDALGKPLFYMPLFHSPLRAPASYAAVSIPQEAEDAINKALNIIFPSVKPLGLDPETGQEVTMLTRHIDRVRDHNAMNAAIERTRTAGFEITQDIIG